MTKKINIYTDGSSIGNPGPGGYGIIMISDNGEYKKEFSKGFKLISRPSKLTPHDSNNLISDSLKSFPTTDTIPENRLKCLIDRQI